MIARVIDVMPHDKDREELGSDARYSRIDGFLQIAAGTPPVPARQPRRRPRAASEQAEEEKPIRRLFFLFILNCNYFFIRIRIRNYTSMTNSIRFRGDKWRASAQLRSRTGSRTSGSSAETYAGGGGVGYALAPSSCIGGGRWCARWTHNVDGSEFGDARPGGGAW